MKYIDIHSHLHFPDYNQDREQVVKRMNDASVGTILVGTSFETSKQALEFAHQHENVWVCIGVHPVDESPRDGKRIFNLAEFEIIGKDSKVVCVGECGLDYGRDGVVSDEEKARQREDFIAQINFAISIDKPIMIHGRSAHHDILEVLTEMKKVHGDKLRGNAHFFTGDLETAQKYIDLDFSLSFTGVLTFTHDYDEAVKYVPEHMIMAETDAPYVSPVPYRGKRNEPTYVTEVYKKIAEIRGVEPEKMAQIMTKNAIRRFNLA